ncbi:YiiD C-terminal domain-containing protein [Clostridium ganghwense]|uniref:YiiD C-terminal domain-containing protein n=1 Tax=Clostridium ganghwense TaxID=312089 RepID=A0ABT4CUH2_9CLOT|nr:YiiD C-terminal domain-containing protein [Clostridium ganghwense]MCY6372573.1 YiiD C-terminal domain-containing protein [Clostridium ganghwense]
MTEYEFQQFLHNQIPLTKAMDFNVLEFTPSKVRISAKLEPNINHMSTAFGGSINCLLTICGWAMTYIHIKEIDVNTHIVLQKSSINYLAPISNDFVAECVLSDKDQENIKNFSRTYSKHKKSKLKLNISCYDEQTLAAKFQGLYVAYK